MINNIKTKMTTNKTFPRLVTWTYNDVHNEVMVGGYDSFNKLIDKLTNAQVANKPKIIREIRYIRAKR